MSYLSQNNILNVINFNENWSNANYSTRLGSLRGFGTRPGGAHGSHFSAESRMELSEAFVIFIVILLTQFPTQHRYTDAAPDLRIARMPYKAIRAAGVHGGGGSLTIYYRKLFSSLFLGNSINSSIRANKLNLSQQGNIHVKHNICSKTQSNT